MFNRSAVLVNYPLTLACLLWHRADPFYVAIVILLVVNKMLISFAGSKVRLHLLNPSFAKNYEKIQDRFRSLLQVQQNERKAGKSQTSSASERAASFVKQGLPTLNTRSISG